MINLEFFVNLWTNTILPTFSNIISFFTTPFYQAVANSGLTDIPIFGWILELLAQAIPDITLLDLIIGTGVITVLIIWVVKFIIGIVT